MKKINLVAQLQRERAWSVTQIPTSHALGSCDQIFVIST